MNRLVSWLMTALSIPFELIDRASEVWGDSDDD